MGTFPERSSAAVPMNEPQIGHQLIRFPLKNPGRVLQDVPDTIARFLDRMVPAMVVMELGRFEFELEQMLLERDQPILQLAPFTRTGYFQFLGQMVESSAA